VKRPIGRVIATTRVGVGVGVERIWGGGVCSHALYRELGSAAMTNKMATTKPNGSCLAGRPEARPI
jgi:hypothetical protein